MLSAHERLIREWWTELLARKNLIGGNLRFSDNGKECIGSISRTEDLGKAVRFYFDWSAEKAPQKEWSEHSHRTIEVPKHRIRDGGPGKPIRFGDYTLILRGEGALRKDEIFPPAAQPTSKLPQEKRAKPEKPPTLFEAVGENWGKQRRPIK